MKTLFWTIFHTIMVVATQGWWLIPLIIWFIVKKSRTA